MDRVAREIAEEGHSVIPDLIDRDAIARLRDAIDAMVRDVAPPALHAAETRALRDDAAITSTGLALSRLLRARPDLAPVILPPPLIASMRALLGDDARLELAGAVVTDRSRPFFRWHTHIDGDDEGARLRSGVWPVVPDVQRVLTLLYLDDLDDDALLVLPRRAGDPTAPPGALGARDWPGLLELRPRAGALVAIEQCTWHAADPMTRDGHRRFVGCYFAAARAPMPSWADPDLARAPLI